MTVQGDLSQKVLTPFDQSLSCSPADAYKPWYDVVLKSARLAVKILTLLSEEVS